MARKKPTMMPNYIPSAEQLEWYKSGIRKGIRIAPKPTTQGLNANEWWIEVFSNGKWHKSKFKYNREQIWDAYYEMYKYYYEKN